MSILAFPSAEDVLEICSSNTATRSKQDGEAFWFSHSIAGMLFTVALLARQVNEDNDDVQMIVAASQMDLYAAIQEEQLWRIK